MLIDSNIRIRLTQSMMATTMQDLTAGTHARKAGIWLAAVPRQEASDARSIQVTARARHYARARGWEVAAVYQEGANTTNSDGAHENHRMLDDLRTRCISALITSDVAALGMDRNALLGFTELLHVQDVALVLLAEGIDTSTFARDRLLTAIDHMIVPHGDEARPPNQSPVDAISRGSLGSARSDATAKLIFSGLAACGCGSLLHPNAQAMLYRCRECGREITEAALDLAFRAALHRLRGESGALDEQAAQAKDRVRRTNEVLTGMLAQRNALAARLSSGTASQTRSGPGSGGSDVGALTFLLQQIDERVPTIQAELDLLRVRQAAIESFMTIAADVDLDWGTLPIIRKRKVVLTVTAQVIVDMGQVHIGFLEMPPYPISTAEAQSAPGALEPEPLKPTPPDVFPNVAAISEETAGAFAADGFPIDPILQKRSRWVAAGYALLALYYVAVSPNLLRGMRWGNLSQLAQDLLLRSELLLVLLGYLAANLIMAALAWRVLSIHRWASWIVAATAVAVAAWACGSLGVSLWGTLTSAPANRSVTSATVSAALIVGYLACTIGLWHVVLTFNRQRAQAFEVAVGRIAS